MSERTNPWNGDTPFTYDGMWIATRTCQSHINVKISGDKEVGWLPYALNRYFASRNRTCRCLVLGCAEGWVVEHLCRAGFAGPIIASDIADKALARTRDRLRQFGNVTYVAADLNSHRFEGPFDLVIAEGVLHHIENLEECLEGLHDALAPDGFLIAVEWEGPYLFQLPDEQVRWINAALNVLPKMFRAGFPGDPEPTLPATAADMTRVYFPRPVPASIGSFDPSEAVAGHLLREGIARAFDIVERKPFGGTLLSYMTGHFPFDLANESPDINAWLQVLMHLEDTLTETGILPPEFVFYVLRRR